MSIIDKDVEFNIREASRTIAEWERRASEDSLYLWSYLQPFLKTKEDCERVLDMVDPGFVCFKIRLRLHDLSREPETVGLSQQ